MNEKGSSAVVVEDPFVVPVQLFVVNLNKLWISGDISTFNSEALGTRFSDRVGVAVSVELDFDLAAFLVVAVLFGEVGGGVSVDGVFGDDTFNLFLLAICYQFPVSGDEVTIAKHVAGCQIVGGD